MINFDFNQDCCGCHSCKNICPVDAICMQSNQEGFLVPVVNTEKCINCGKCEKVCPHITTFTDTSSFSLECFKDKKAYLYFSEKKERMHSASGGFVYEAMARCLDEGGVVCGCVWDESFKAVHIVTDKKEDLPRLQSSKYVQSEIGNCYNEIKKALKDGKKVVFCGTPCQTAGLKTYLGEDFMNLTSIALICHGVPSPMVWKAYKESLEKKYRGRMVFCNMRDKRAKGYKQSHARYEFVRDLSARPLHLSFHR